MTHVKWKRIPLRHCFRLVSGSTPSTSESDYWDGDATWITPDDLGRLDKKRISVSARQITAAGAASIGDRCVPPGSLVLSTRAPIGHLGIADAPLCTNQGCKSLLPKPDIDVDYAYYQLLARRAELRSLGAGTTFPELSRTQLAAVPFWRPPHRTQRAIADFLDRETERIDALVTKKQRLIGLLQEKRTALISHAVTKGLDPDVPMKDSGVEWLGVVPAAWDVGPLRRFWNVIDCKHKTVTFLDEGVPVASIGEVHGMRVDLAGARLTSHEEAMELSEGGRRPVRGDVIISRNATVGEAALVDTDRVFCLGQDVSLIRSAEHDQRYLVYLLQSPGMRQQIEALVIGSTFRRINVGRIKELLVPCPPEPTQGAIGQFCQRIFRSHADIVARTTEALRVLNEYRSALITAAVTGQIDVRTYRRDPEEVLEAS